MFRKIFVLAGIAVSSYALAGKTAANLKDIRATDFCAEPIVTVILADKNDGVLESKILDALKKQDALFNTGFFKTKKDCNTFFSINVDIMIVKTGAGTPIGYSYSNDLSIQPWSVSKIILLDGRTLESLAPVVYQMGSLGLIGSVRSELEEAIIESVEEDFQDFVLDWRKTH